MLLFIAAVLIVCVLMLKPYTEETDVKVIIVVLGSTAGLIIGTVAGWMCDNKKFDK